MSKNFAALVAASIAAVLALACAGSPALAGTTGGISGRVVDPSGNPISGARVSAASPSQSAATTSDPRGFYSMLNLSPDTYAVTASKDGFDSATVAGVTVQADQSVALIVTLQPTVHVIGHVTTTATVTAVSKSTTGDLYAVNAKAIASYQGSAGGAETLYSQNGVVGSLPGVVRDVGTGGGYAGNGSLSMRGGTTDQVGFELEGIPLNRSFDSANATSFVTNGLASLEVYTGGEPADAGRSMAGYINETIARGKYPGGADLTGVVGSPTYNHTVQMDAYGATPDTKFSWYFSTLAINSDYSFSNRHNLDNANIDIPANDPGCADFNFINSLSVDCTKPQSYDVPISQAVWQGFINPSAAIRDNVLNLHEAVKHGDYSDDFQALYVVGTTGNGFPYSGSSLDPALADFPAGPNGPILWPSGALYTGRVGQAYNPNSFLTLTWPSANGSTGPVPTGLVDDQNTQSSIEKLSYTHVINSSSFVRVYGYSLYSLWAFDQPTNPYVGDSFYQLHDNATGYTMNYQNQLSQQNLLRVDLDYVKDLTLRYNYAPDYIGEDAGPDANSGFLPNGNSGTVLCYGGTTGDLTNLAQCTSPSQTVAFRSAPFAYWNSLPEIDTDAAIADSFRPTDSLLFDFGMRLDRFQTDLTPLQITGSNGIAEQAQNDWGTCLDGYAYPVGEPCNAYLTQSASVGPASVAPGMGAWQNVGGSLIFNDFSPRFGFTYTLPDHDVFRASVGRYVEPPASFGQEYVAAPFLGAGDTVSVLNNFYSGLGFVGDHDVKPQDSTNIDASYERDFGGGISAKITPFWRTTRNQILSLPVNPLNPTFVTGYNFGAGRINGSEFLVDRNRQGPNGLSATLAATYTNTKIRYERTLGNTNFIDTINQSITNYNVANSTHYPLFDPNGYYSPSETQSPESTTPSFDVKWVVNLNLDEHAGGWDITPTFNYQSGNPYGDPLNFPNILLNPNGNASFGPDPYTHTFDAPGSLVGPSWLTMNIGFSHDLMTNMKASFLVTNVFTSVHNHGYPWEFPTGDQVLAYEDNTFYENTPLPGPTYLGDDYYPYAPATLNDAREYVFSVSTKL
jgi:hypothetical protein